ncbi:hypothetical protein ACFL0Q_03130 [Thermodesulfobacteriota bacterium]
MTPCTSLRSSPGRYRLQGRAKDAIFLDALDPVARLKGLLPLGAVLSHAVEIEAWYETVELNLESERR